MSEYLETTIDKFIFRVATDRLYSQEGVWAQADGRRVRVGLTDYQQQLNGDVAFVHLKEVGAKLAAGDELAEIETIKANVNFLSPVGGTLVEINTDLDLNSEVINQDPYGKGWLAVLEVADWNVDRAGLLDAQAYLVAMRAQAEEALDQS